MDRNERMVGGWASILLGVSYLVVGVGFFLQPTAQRPGSSATDQLASLAETRGAYLAVNWSFVVGALIALAAVPAISRVVNGRRGWVRWGQNLAYLGFAVTAVNFLRIVTRAPVEAAYFVGTDDELVRALITGNFIRLSLDPDGWLVFGAVGIWVLIVSVAALRDGVIPPLLGAVGIATAIAYWLVVVGNILGITPLIGIAAGVGGVILGPIFYIWMGLRLKSQALDERKTADGRSLDPGFDV